MNQRRLARRARRVALQARCALQRDDLRERHDEFVSHAHRADRIVDGTRGIGALLLVGAATFLVAGPAGGTRVLRRGFALALVARQALRFLR